jgi:hypothetical protein
MTDKCKCGKDATIEEYCDTCKMGADMNEDLQELINKKRGTSKMPGDVEE